MLCGMVCGMLNLNTLSKSIILKDITQLTANENNPLLIDLYNSYKLAVKSDSKAACSLVNAIITHKLYYFAITRRSLDDLIRTDVNHRNSSSFEPKAYKALLFHLSQTLGLIELVHKGTARTAAGFKVIHPDIVQYLDSLGIDKDSQLKELIAFCGNTKDKTK